MLLAAAGAFTFVLSAIKLPSVTGSSSHPTGTGAGAVLFGPPVMAFLGTIVLLFQALLLAHGGLTTLGANVFSMAIAGPWAAYGVWRLLKAAKAPTWLGVFAALATANLVTYCVTSLQLALAYPDATTGFGGAAVKFLGVFAVTQIPHAIAEGLRHHQAVAGQRVAGAGDRGRELAVHRVQHRRIVPHAGETLACGSGGIHLVAMVRRLQREDLLHLVFAGNGAEGDGHRIGPLQGRVERSLRKRRQVIQPLTLRKTYSTATSTPMMMKV